MTEPLRLAVTGHAIPHATLAAILLRTGIPLNIVSPAGAEVILCSGDAFPEGDTPALRLATGRDWHAETKRAFTAVRSGRLRLDGRLNRHVVDLDLATVLEAALEGREESELPWDPHGRPDPAMATAVRAKAIELPSVDRLCRMLGEELWRLAGRSGPPPAPRFFFCMTLDIDSDGMFAGRAAARAVRDMAKLNPGRVGSLVRAAIRTKIYLQKDPHVVIRQLAEALDGLEVPATIFVQTHRVHKLDNYTLGRDRELLTQLMDVTENCGHEIGLHSSYSTRDMENGLWAEQWRRLRRLLGRKVTAVHRGHYLRTEPNPRFVLPEAAGQLVDSTLGYGGVAGFRRGTAWPFLAGGAVELPPCVMDSTLRHHMGLGPEEAYDAAVRLLDNVRQTGGAFVPIFHPHNMEDYFWPGWRDVFFDLIAAAKQRGATMQSLAHTARSLYNEAMALERELDRSNP